MGSGERARRIALGTTTGQAEGIQAHQLAMIPIMQQQAEMQLSIQEKAFEQELEQTEKMGLLSQKLQPDQPDQPAPILMPAEVTKGQAANNFLIYIGLAALAYFLLRKK